MNKADISPLHAWIALVLAHQKVSPVSISEKLEESDLREFFTEGRMPCDTFLKVVFDMPPPKTAKDLMVSENFYKIGCTAYDTLVNLTSWRGVSLTTMKSRMQSVAEELKTSGFIVEKEDLHGFFTAVLTECVKRFAQS